MAVSAVATEPPLLPNPLPAQQASSTPAQPLLPLLHAGPTRYADVAEAVSVENPFLAISGRRFAIAPEDAVTEDATSADAPHEVLEPAVVESRTFFRSCRCFHYSDYTAFMHNATPSAFIPVIRIAQKDLTSGGGWQIVSNLDLGSNHPEQVLPFDRSADPALAASPDNSGVNPSRVYLSGVTLNKDASGIVQDTQVNVWYTDDAGFIWNRYPGLEYHHNGGSSNWFDDKPHIAVSRNPNNTGNVYLAVVVQNDPTLSGQSAIKIFRLVSCGAGCSPSWQDMGYAVIGYSVQSPRLDVNNNSTDSNGTVYLSWLNWGTNTLNVATSTNQGASWSAAPPLSIGTFVLSGSALICSNSPSSNCVQGISMLTSRWNDTMNRLELVFHRRIASIGGSSAEVVHTTFAGGSFGSIDPVSSKNPPHYTWDGAIACATDGTCLVTFYDMDPNELGSNPGLAYRVVGRTLYTGSSDTVLYNTVTAANPYAHLWSQFSNFYTPGEYQDVVYYNGHYTAAALYSTGSQNKNDIFVLKP